MIATAFAILLQIAPADTVTLPDVLSEARLNHPLHGQFDRLDRMDAAASARLNTHYLPQLMVSGQSQYQSDVTEIAIPVPGVTSPAQPRERYSVSLGVDQLIWDGGAVESRKRIALLEHAAERASVDADLLKTRQQVTDTYFSVLVLQSRAAVLQLAEEELQARMQDAQVAVRHGAMASANAAAIEAELLTLRQEIAEVRSARASATEALETLTALKFSDATYFTVPPVGRIEGGRAAAGRPEVRALALRAEQLEASEALDRAITGPQLSAFGQAAVGRPGLDMFDDRFQPYYIVGVTARWPLWNWNRDKRRREELALQRESVLLRKEAVERDLRVAAEASLRRLQSLDELLDMDEGIIRRREAIVAEAASRFVNGVITATEYLTEHNALHRTRHARELRLVQRAQEFANYQILIGEE